MNIQKPTLIFADVLIAVGRSSFAVIRRNLSSFSPLLEMGVRSSVILGVNSSGKPKNRNGYMVK